MDSSDTVKQGSRPWSQSSLGRDKNRRNVLKQTARLHCANNHLANWLTVSVNVKPCSSRPFPRMNWWRQQPPFCNGIIGKIENDLVLKKCDMWSKVIRAHRVKTASSYCETIPMWTSNYYDGISASSSSSWWGFIVKQFYDRRGTKGSEWVDECKLSTKCRHCKESFISSQRSHVTPTLLSFHFLLPLAAFNSSRHTVELHQKPYRKFPGRCEKTFLSVHYDLLGCAAQWVSALFRMRQLHIALFCWALKKCLCDCGFMCIRAALHYCQQPTACCFS